MQLRVDFLIKAIADADFEFKTAANSKKSFDFKKEILARRRLLFEEMELIIKSASVLKSQTIAD